VENERDSKVKEAVPNYQRKYTYTDYLQWDDDIRWELIDGVPYMMSAPTVRHQEILGNLYLILGNFLKGKSCKVYLAPFDVRLNAFSKDDTVVQPDIQVICDKSIMMKTGCTGAPDMVIEILSPSSGRMDRKLKYDKYQQAGVREYWIVDPEQKLLQVGILSNNEYITRIYDENDTAPVKVLDGFEVNLVDVFSED